MLPFELLFYPASLFRRFPVREWRQVTVWLKWGLIIPFLAIIARVTLMDPTASSSIFSLLVFIGEESEIVIPVEVRYGLFLILQGLVLILAWLVRSFFIYLYYRVSAPSFSEGSIALSVAGASMVPGVWYLMPYGYLPATVHSLVLTSYLLARINRTSARTAVVGAIFPALVPLLF